MKEPKKKPIVQTYELEFPTFGELRLECKEQDPKTKSVQPLEDNVNEDLIRRLIARLKKM